MTSRCGPPSARTSPRSRWPYPISAQTYDETQLYAPGARRFFELGSTNTEVDVFELRDARSGYPILHSVIIGSLAKIVGSLETAWVIAHAVFPAAVWLIFTLTARYVGLATLSAATLAAGICLFAFGPRNYLLLGTHALIQPLELTRMPQPGLSIIFFLSAIVLTGLAIERRRNVLVLLAGIAIAANFYSYYYYWVALGLGFSCWTLVALVRKNWLDARTLAAIGCVALVPDYPASCAIFSVL